MSDLVLTSEQELSEILGTRLADRGAVESVRKTVVNQRLCMGGMRWGDGGGDSVAHWRGLYRRDQDQRDDYGAQFALAA